MNNNQVRIKEALDHWKKEDTEVVRKAVIAITEMARCVGIDYSDKIVNQTIAYLLKEKPEYNFRGE